MGKAFAAYKRRPLASLQSLDKSGPLIYAGTFIRLLFNALRIGFMVLPSHLVSAFNAGRNFMSRRPPTLDQGILAGFITGGGISAITYAKCGRFMRSESPFLQRRA